MAHKIVFVVLAFCGLSSASDQNVFEFQVNTSVVNPIDRSVHSKWMLQGKLTLQRHDKKVFAKFEDIRTNAYNGNETDMPYSEPLDVPKESNVLLKPFVINYNKLLVQSISVEPDDVLWSVNIKRAVASIFQANLKYVTRKEEYVDELSIYGNCKTRYERIKSDDQDKLTKSFTDDDCDGISIKSFKTAQPVQFADARRKPFTRNVTRNYFLHSSGYVEKISSDSKIIIHKLNDYESYTRNLTLDQTDHNENWIVQKHEFKLLTATDIDKPIDVSKVTILKNIRFEVDEDLTQGRRKNVENISKSELISMWLLEVSKTIEILKQKAANIPIDKTYEDQFQLLRRIATKLDLKSFQDLHSEILKMNDTESATIWICVLSVVGSRDSVNFIKQIYQELSDFSAMFLLSQFPSYIKNYSTELIMDMEPLMRINKSNGSVIPTGILSFATLVSKTYELNNCDIETYNKYVNEYTKLFAESDNLRIKIAYLDGLHNLQADIKLFVPIIRNNTENFNIRILAINAVKDQLQFQPDKAYNMFWPMVKDTTLKLEIRIAAFDVILNSHITEEQFVTMYEFLNSKIGSDYEHIYNYFYTTFQSVQNNTKCPDHMVRFIHLKPLKKTLAKPVMTGNYRSAVIDRYARYGTHFELKYIEDPLTNYPNAFYLKFERFGMGMNYGSFAIRVQVDNLFSTHHFNEYLSKAVRQNTYKVLTDIVEKHNLLSLEEMDVSMHITLYSDGKAFYDLYFDKQARIYTQIINDVAEVMQRCLSVYYPVNNVDYSFSDFGTPISSEIEVNFAEVHDFNWPHAMRLTRNRSYHFGLRFVDASNVSVKSYNPVDDVFFGSSNYYRNDMTFNTNFFIADESGYLPIVWTDDENTEYFRTAVDEISMNYVENENYLHKHCKDCKHLLKVYQDPNYMAFINDDQGLFMGVLNGFLEISGYRLHLESGDYQVGHYLVPTIDENVDSNYHDHSIVIPFLWHLLSREHNLFNAKYGTQSETFSVKPQYQGKIKNEMHLYIDPHEMYFEFTRTDVETNDKFQIFNASSVYIDKNIEQLVKANVSLEFNKASYLMCMNSNITYPKASKDVFSMVPPEPALFAFSMLYGPYNESTQECPSAGYMNITATLSTSDEQMEELNHLRSWYKKCKTQSEGLRYFAPTEECYRASRRIMTYQNFTAEITADPDLVPFLSKIIRRQNKSDRLNETNWKLTALINEEYLNSTLRTFLYDKNEWEQTNEFYHSQELPSVLSAYIMRSPNYDLISSSIMGAPLDRYCAITPKIVKTFGGRIIENYESKFNIDKLGYVERSNVSGNGLVITRVNEHEPKIAFKLWGGSSQPFKLEVYPEETKLNVTINEEQVDKRAVHDYYPVTIQIEDDHLHITTLLSEIYYNKDYVMVKMSSHHVKYLAGLCSFEENNISV